MIGTLDSVSKPGKRIHVDSEELAKLVKGKRVQGVRGIGMGEMIFVRTGSARWLEGRDAVRQGVGGELMVRVASM